MQSTVESKGGTIRWQAPEIIHPPSEEDAYPTRQSDIYAFACVCYEVRCILVGHTAVNNPENSARY